MVNKIKIIGLIIIVFSTFNFATTKKNTTEIRYYYLGSYKALMGIPQGKGPFPVIIYSYDEFYDWAGKKLSAQIGYNLEEIAAYFVKKGFVCVIPVDRYRKVNAIIGIAKYLEKKPYIDKKNMNLVGISEGAFLNFIASYKYPYFKSMTCIGPISINDKGYLSLEYNYQLRKNHSIPIFFLMIRDVGWRINEQSKVYRLFKTKFNSVELKTYFKEKRWFWNMDHEFAKDINRFIQSQYNLPNGTSKNTYKSVKY